MNQPRIRAFVQYITAVLLLDSKITLSRISESPLPLAESLSHDQLTAALATENSHQQTLLWSFVQALIKLEQGFLVIDDTIIEKPHGVAKNKPDSFLRWVYSNKESRAIKGIQWVMVLWVTEWGRFPLGWAIYDGQKSKIELVMAILSQIRNKLGLRKCHVLMDSWYAANKLFKQIHAYGWTFVARVKKNRLINGIALPQAIPRGYGQLIGRMGPLKINLIRNGPHFLVTNRLTMSRKTLQNWYKKRWEIEEAFRVLKVVCHLKDCQCRVRAAWENHIFLVCMAFSALEFRSKQLGITIYKLRSRATFKDWKPFLTLWNSVLGGT